MKKTLLLSLTFFMCSLAGAQVLKVKNTSNCTINFYLAAHDPACSTTSSSVTYAIGPGGTLAYTFGTTAWGGTPPGAGYSWSFIKEWNGCGVYSHVSPDCSTGTNYNVCGVGGSCSGLPLSSCMKIDNSCNTCTGVKTSWTAYPSGDVLVQIY